MHLLAKLFILGSATLAFLHCTPAGAQNAFHPDANYQSPAAYQPQVPFQQSHRQNYHQQQIYQQTNQQIAYRPHSVYQPNPAYQPHPAYLPPTLYRSPAYSSQARPGVYGRTTQTTNNYRRRDAHATMNQRIGSRLPMAGFGNTTRVFGPTGRNGLPPTSLDSFVVNAGGYAERIYGDEGADGRSPYDEFTADHRINAGIVNERDAGLTTGHGSMLPDAWGNDEFLGAERSLSGANLGNRRNIIDEPPNSLPTRPPSLPPSSRRPRR